MKNSDVFFHQKGFEISEEDMRETNVFPCFNDSQALHTPLDLLDMCREQSIAFFGAHGDVQIRNTHITKTRKHEARHKKPSEVGVGDTNDYAQRACFVLEIPGYETTIGGNEVSLKVVGMKPYDKDNLSRSSNVQHFMLAIGYQVGVCLNLCLTTDGTKLNVQVRNAQELENAVIDLFQSYSADKDLETLKRLNQVRITSTQLMTLLGRMGSYQFAPKTVKADIPNLEINGNLLNRMHEGVWKGAFALNGEADMSMWQAYNLMTEGVKYGNSMSTFMEQNLNCLEIANGVAGSLSGLDTPYKWYLN